MIVVWRVTEHCNLGCQFCAYDRNVQRPRRNAEPAEIERFGAVLAEYQRVTGDSVLVSWLGGEPLLWPPLTKLTETFARSFSLRVSTTTNATTLGSVAVRTHLLTLYSELTISIDGIGSVHDELRRWGGGFEKMRAAIQQLVMERERRESSLKIRANVVLMRHTITAFAELCEELANWGIDEITFNQLGGRDRPEFFPANRLLPAQVESFAEELPRLREHLAARNVQLRGSDSYLSRLRASTIDRRVSVDDCHPGASFLFIDESGWISPCSFTRSSYGIPAREVQTANDVRELRARFSHSQRTHRDSSCDDCQSTHQFEKFAPV